MISRMHRAEIVGPISLLSPVIDTIQAEGVVHLQTIPLAEYEAEQFLHRLILTESEAREKEGIAQIIEMLEEALRFIPETSRPDRYKTASLKTLYEQWEQKQPGILMVTARSLHAKLRSLIRRRKNLQDDFQTLVSYEDMVGTLVPLVETHELPKNYEFIGVILDTRSHMPVGLFKQELGKATNGEYSFYETPSGRRRISALVGYAREHSYAVRHLILETGIGKMNLPGYLRDSPFEEALIQIQKDIKELKKKLREMEDQIEKFHTDQAPELLAMLDVCKDRRTRFDALSAIAVTDYTFIIRGWVPHKDFDALENRLRIISDGSVVIRNIKATGDESPPVVLNNPKPIKQFEPLLKFFPLPRYGSVDPTKFVAIIFPPIFGLMLADIAYGAILAVLTGLIFLSGRKKPMVRRITFVAATCAFFSIAFGLAFGEFFGELGHKLFGLAPLWQERFTFTGENKAEALMGYMAIAIAVGIFQVTLGLILGIINSKRNHDRETMLNNLARIAGVFFLLFLVGRLAQFLPPVFTTFGIVMLVIFVVLLIAQIVRNPIHGFLLPLEVLSTIGNILSYVRIMAIGLVSVVLAFLANFFGGMAGNVILAVIIAALVHALNLALGIIDPTIQGLRLQYVEFFSKFFLGGGRPYSPFRKTGGAS